MLPPAGPVIYLLFGKGVRAFTLDNGMKFILIDRHEDPGGFFMTIAGAGLDDQKQGAPVSLPFLNIWCLKVSE
ncbi:MAG: hypothetical protein WA705_21150 [Candidatus Ozemobacteraceae bacterium]